MEQIKTTKDKEYTDKEMSDIMDSAGFPKGVTFTQLFKIAYWSMFNRKKLNKFCHNIKKGMSIHYSFTNLKNKTT